MERVYIMYHHKDMGYCAMIKTSFLLATGIILVHNTKTPD